MAFSNFQTRTVLFLSVILSGFGLSIHAQEKPHSYQPVAGFVPDAKTAIQIAVAVWNPIYSEKQIASEKPFKAVLSGRVWTVQGSLPRGSVGGVAIAEIDKRDGRILRVSHGK